MRNQIILSIPLYANTEDQFRQKWEKGLKNCIREYESGTKILEESIISQIRNLRLNQKPPFYRYNDIVGYAELEISGGGCDILIYYHMNGDSRKKYNKRANKINKKAIYQSEYDRESVIRLDRSSNNKIRKCIKKAIENIDLKCKEWNIYFNKELYINQIEYFDYKRKFNDNELKNSNQNKK